MNKNQKSIATRMVHTGRDASTSFGFVNPPLYRGSTVLFKNAGALRADIGEYHYGMPSTPTSDHLCDMLVSLEGAETAIITPSGLASIALLISGFLSSGDHVLVVDSVYRPTRRFLDRQAVRWGIETTYYDPLIGRDIEHLIKPNTRMIFMESPGSQTMEIQDVPALVAAAKSKGLITALDNTWATPVYFPAHAFGVDISLHAATKYFGGHADILLGTLSAINGYGEKLKEIRHDFGVNCSAEEVLLCMRGLRSLSTRLEAISRSALKIAKWLSQQKGIARVLHPALPDHPQHALWQRDFSGASGLFSVILETTSNDVVDAFLDRLKLFGFGYSWGGYESLVISFDARDYRTATQWAPSGSTLRFSIGLEATDDLIADLQEALMVLS